MQWKYVLFKTICECYADCTEQVGMGMIFNETTIN